MIKNLVKLFFFISFFNFSILSVSTSVLSKGLLFLILLLLLIEKILTPKPNIISKQTKPFKLGLLMLIIWGCYGILSLTWSKDLVAGINILNGIIFTIAVVVMLLLVVNKKQDFYIIINTISVATIVHNVIGWSEVITQKYYFAPIEYVPYYSFRRFPVSTFFNTNNFATYLTMSFFILFISYQITKKISHKIVLVVTMLSSVYLIYKTDSRGSLAALILGCVLLLFYAIYNSKISKKKMISLYLISTILLIVSIYMFTNNMEFLKSLFVKDKNFESNNVRFNLWKNGLVFLKETNFFGVGAGSLDYWMLNYAKYPTNGVLKMHNWWIEILSTYGIFVFLIYVYSYLSIYKAYFVLSIDKEYSSSNITAIFLALMTAFIITVISPSSLFLNEWIWIFIGIMIFGTNVFKKDIGSEL